MVCFPAPKITVKSNTAKQSIIEQTVGSTLPSPGDPNKCFNMQQNVLNRNVLNRKAQLMQEEKKLPLILHTGVQIGNAGPWAPQRINDET